jgi:hypothetical protein
MLASGFRGRIIRFDFGAFPSRYFHTVQFPAPPEEGGIMRNMIVALGSFVSGVLFAFALGLGSPHTSTVLHSVAFAQNRVAPLVDRPAAVPVVPVVGLSTLNDVKFGAGYSLKLDGMNCVNCTVAAGGTIEYSGGAFRVESLVPNGTVSLTPLGAAANTVVLLQYLGLMGPPAQQHQTPINPDKPTLKTASFKAGTTLTFSSPVGIKP